jgi:hypothetical protein
MNTLKPTHIISYTIPDFDSGELTSFSAPLAGLDRDAVTDALTAYDAQIAGLGPEQGGSAGFDMLAFEPSGATAAFIIRTRGLGPTPAQNTLGHGHVTPIR